MHSFPFVGRRTPDPREPLTSGIPSASRQRGTARRGGPQPPARGRVARLATASTLLALACTAFVGPHARTLALAAETGGTAGDVAPAGTTDVFDPAVPHTLQLSFADEDYQAMLQTFYDTDEKAWLTADLVIDGTRLDDVGIRLKGNSTLMGLRAGRTGGFAAPAPSTTPSPGTSTALSPRTTPTPGTAPSPGTSPAPTPSPTAAVPRQMPAFTSGVSADKPESLPWLIRFDEFVEGQRYQGHREIAVRPNAMGAVTPLREAMGLALIDRAGEPSQRFSFSSFTVNDRPSSLRLLVENPGDAYAEGLGPDGTLFKADSEGSFTYKGDDPTAYEQDFKQISSGEEDLTPVVRLIKWVEQSSDEEFVQGLRDRLDVDSFARYVALQNLLLNWDDMAGPGKNYYLWYDRGTERMRVISWDLNLALSGNVAQGPYESGGMPFMGGMRPPTNQQAPGATPQATPAATPGTPTPSASVPAAANGQVPAAMPQLRAGHKLKERFLALDAFKPVYEAAYRDLYQQLFAGGEALDQLTTLAAQLARVPGAKAAEVTSDAEALRTTITGRTDSLATNAVILGS